MDRQLLAPAPSNILVVEDEAPIREVLTTALEFQGHSVTQAHSGSAGAEAGLREAFDLIVLDIMLPGMNGFEICERLRLANKPTPVLFLTARDAEDDRIRGFLSGADDYLTKPFSIDELLLRIGAILRRTGKETAQTSLGYGDLLLNRDAHEVWRGGERIDLSPTEYRLLEYLMLNAGRVLSKSELLSEIWDGDSLERNENVVELYIGYLRKKIDKNHPPLIHTKRSIGYVLRSAD